MGRLRDVGGIVGGEEVVALAVPFKVSSEWRQGGSSKGTVCSIMIRYLVHHDETEEAMGTPVLR